MVNAIINSGPREDSTRIGRAGTVRRQAVDVSPLRRVNQAIWLCCTGAREASFRNIKSIAGKRKDNCFYHDEFIYLSPRSLMHNEVTKLLITSTVNCQLS